MISMGTYVRGEKHGLWEVVNEPYYINCYYDVRTKSNYWFGQLHGLSTTIRERGMGKLSTTIKDYEHGVLLETVTG